MQYVQLGRTGLQVSRLCLGTMNFGPYTEPADAHALMDRALEVGINFFDTANVYGGREAKGRTEEIVGDWFASGGQRRDRVVLATKVYGRMSDWPNDGRLSARHIKRACEASLRRLRTDWIDLYQMHHVDRRTPWEEIWQAMETLVAEGKVLYVGSSNFAGWHIARGCETAARRNGLGLVSEQSLYNLAVRDVELEVGPACEGYGVGILPWSPLHGGALGGALARAAEGRRASDRVQQRVEALRPALERYEALCADLGHAPAHVALAWLLTRPAVAAPIVGPRTGDQLETALGALEVSLDDEALGALDAIFPGPGGPAPEAYAW